MGKNVKIKVYDTAKTSAKMKTNRKMKSVVNCHLQVYSLVGWIYITRRAFNRNTIYCSISSLGFLSNGQVYITRRTCKS